MPLLPVRIQRSPVKLPPCVFWRVMYLPEWVQAESGAGRRTPVPGIRVRAVQMPGAGGGMELSASDSGLNVLKASVPRISSDSTYRQL